MSALDDYKQFIDDLVERRTDVCAEWVTEKRQWPDSPENKRINEFVSSLNDFQREILAELLQNARDGGIHDVLEYFNEQIDLAGMRLVKNGRELPHEPFDTELYYDWTCRKEGDEWPDPDNTQ